MSGCPFKGSIKFCSASNGKTCRQGFTHVRKDGQCVKKRFPRNVKAGRTEPARFGGVSGCEGVRDV